MIGHLEWDVIVFWLVGLALLGVLAIAVTLGALKLAINVVERILAAYRS